MKNIYVLKKTAWSLLLILVLGSCKDLFNVADIKTKPNAVTDVDIPTLISGTEVGLAETYEDTQVRIAYIWAGQLAGLSRQHQAFGNYIVSSNTFSWTNVYPIAGQARLIQTKADALGDKWTKGVGEVIEALLIAKVTDLYGDVPYSQAFDNLKYPTPVFDKQADVYTELLATLDDAIQNLSASTGSDFSTGDFLYGGDPALWMKAAYTLEARLYLHLGNYSKAISSATLGLASIKDDMLVPHGTSQGVDENLNYDFFNNNRPGDTGFDPPAYLPVFMKSRIGSANTKTNETAMYNHFFKSDITAVGALDPNIVDGVFTIDAPHPILTYYENQLILAESYARQNTLGSALTALNTVRAGLNSGYIHGKSILSKYTTGGNLRYDAYSSSDFDPSGLANPKNYPDQQSALLYEIISQKYIVMLAQYEVYTDVRRLVKATPVIQLSIPIPSTAQTPTGTFPARYIYPQTELNTNPNTPNPAPDQWQLLPIFQ